MAESGGRPGRSRTGAALHHLERRRSSRACSGSATSWRQGRSARRPRAGALRIAGAGRPAGRRGHSDLHLGHDGAAQRRHPDPPQFREQRRNRRPLYRIRNNGHRPVLPAPIPRLRAHGHVLLRLRGLQHRLRRKRRDRRPEPARGPADRHGQRAPGFREDLCPRHGYRPRRLGPEKKDILLGAQGRAGVRAAERSTSSRSAAGWSAGAPGEQARLFQGRGQDRRPDPVLCLGRGAAVQGHRRILLCHGPGRDRRVRPDGDVPRHLGQFLRRTSGSGRSASPSPGWRSRSLPTARS